MVDSNNSPQHLAIMVTERCNLECYHCFRHVSHQKTDLDLDILSKLSERIERTSINSVRITGGEPLLIKNIEKSIIPFSRFGLHTSLGTNGTLLSPEKIKKLKETGLNEIWISLHSNNVSTHDKMSGKIGSFHSTIRALNGCLKQNIDTGVNFPVSINNIHNALQTLKFLDDLEVKRINLIRVTPLGRACSNNDFIHIENEMWLGLMKKIFSIPLRKSKIKMQSCTPNSIDDGKCTIFPFKHLNMSPSGLIYPCSILNNKKGMEIGHVSELLNKDWEKTITLFNERIKEKYNLSIKPIPCITEKVCPLYSTE